MTRTRLSAGIGLAAVFSLAAFQWPTTQQAAPSMIVHKSPTCGCCSKWVDHAKTAGFTPQVHDMPDVEPIKVKNGVPADLRSCHTTLIGGYVIEGHVPLDLVQKLLKEKPMILGLSVPGMVAGSPGMDGPTKEAYDVVSFDKDGKTAVYAKR